MLNLRKIPPVCIIIINNGDTALLKQTIFMIRNATTEDMKTLTVCLNKLMSEGYNIDFKVAEKGEELTALQTEKNYRPGEIHVVNFYRFEGASDPADNSILYAIETNDGAKGTLVDAFGPYADRKVEDFMKAVEDISKKNAGDVTPEMINGV